MTFGTSDVMLGMFFFGEDTKETCALCNVLRLEYYTWLWPYLISPDWTRGTNSNREIRKYQDATDKPLEKNKERKNITQEIIQVTTSLRADGFVIYIQ